MNFIKQIVKLLLKYTTIILGHALPSYKKHRIYEDFTVTAKRERERERERERSRQMSLLMSFCECVEMRAW